VFVALTSKGRRTIQRLFPSFNAEEGVVTTELTPREQDILAKLLRSVLHSAEHANGCITGESPSARKTGGS
jgi:DNA-binding MarR family transcriptional regulator